MGIGGLGHTLNESYKHTAPAVRNLQTTYEINNLRPITDSAYMANALFNISLPERHIPKQVNTPKQIISAIERQDGTLIYIANDGDSIFRHGGTRAWKNNNPGNLRYTPFARNNGAIGEAGGFAIFPDTTTGVRALCNLLQGNKYRNMTMADAIRTYAPAFENDTLRYMRFLANRTGLDVKTKLEDMNPDQLDRVIAAIRVMEGWRPGTETIVKSR